MPIGARERNLLIKIVIVVIITIVTPNYFSDWADVYRREAVSRGQTLQTELREVRTNRKNVTEQRRLYDAYLTSYQLRQDRGVVAGTVDRVGLRNVMYDIKQKRRLGVIDFTFGTSQRVPSEESVFTEGSTANIGILPMHVSMPMLHDMDIFMFLDDLSKRAAGVFVPLSCEMTRLEADFSAALRDNVRGECDVVWVVVDDADGGSA
ncbi:MAG: hypothetical protein ACR2P4_07435 [Gammaproteobacteria bacterium]